MKPKALDLFCGAGGAAAGLARAGFDVYGVDWVPQPRYPFTFICRDIERLRLTNEFDFIWASPPCQRYSRAQRIQDNTHPDWVQRIRHMLMFEANHTLYCIENVVGAPLRDPIELCGAMFGLQVYRHRLFECSFSIAAPVHPEHTAPVRKMGRKPEPDDFMHVVGNFSGVAQARKAMGIDWMVRDELREAIPPAYAEYIGRAALEHIRQRQAA